MNRYFTKNIIIKMSVHSRVGVCRRFNTRVSFIAILSCASIIVYFSISFLSFDNDEEMDTEIRAILQSTPYLWRKFTFMENESVSSRVEDQKLWITRLSQTNFIKTAPKKTILVQDGMELYYQTEGRLRCPYAPEFENKCELVEENWMHLLQGSWKYNGISAVTGIRNWDFRLYESLVPHHVKQILYVLEPPHIAKNAHLGRNNALVASYWKGSDIPIPYRRYISNTSVGVDANELDKTINGKTKMVAAMISNCISTNGRLDFIQELQKYVEVDVYGKCGNFSCPKGQHLECMSILERDYKFYLAIENSNCEDYITEKFFDNALKYDLVPIVMGAHPNSYKLNAPSNSYIHVNDFETPKALAEYLHLLDQDKSLYIKYFEWKGTGYLTNESILDFFCRVCGMLFYADFTPLPTWRSSTIVWKDVNQCLSNSEWYWR